MFQLAPTDPLRIDSASIGKRPRLLLMAADPIQAGDLTGFLAAHRMLVKTAADAAAGISLAIHEDFDLILLDASLPRLNGFEALRLIRERCEIPIIMLTDSGSRDRVTALELGADDCLSIPFDFPELLARVRAIMRRRGGCALAPPPLEIRNVRIDPGSREVWVGGRNVDLTSAEYVILETLMRAAGRVVTRERLAWALRQREPTAPDRSLDVHMARLRSKLGQTAVIRTVRGEGYFYCCDPLGR